MVNKKILLSTIFFLFVFSFNIFSQSQENAQANSLDETQIVLSEDSSNSSNSINSEYKAPSVAGTFVKMILALVIICAAIYWVLRIVKKKTNVVKDEDDFLRRAAYITVGNGKTVEVVTLVDRAYVIGVSDEKITLLEEIKDNNERDKDLIESLNLNADKKQNTKKPVRFSDVLDMFTKKNTNKGSVFNSTETTLDNLINKKESKE